MYMSYSSHWKLHFQWKITVLSRRNCEAVAFWVAATMLLFSLMIMAPEPAMAVDRTKIKIPPRG